MIQAPAATPAKPPAVASSPTPASPPAPTPAPAPKTAPSPETSIAAPLPEDTASTNIRRKPRAIPERRRAKGIDARHSTSDELLRHPKTGPTSGNRPSGRQAIGIGRLLLPFFFIIVGGAIVYGLCYNFLPGGPGESLRRSTGSPPGHTTAIGPLSSKDKTTPSTSYSNPKSPNSTQPVGDPPPITADGNDAIKAEELLGRFLSTTTLEERLSMIDPPLSADQLKDTILAKPFPEAISVSPETPAYNAIEKFSNFPFRVTFQGGEGSVVDYTIVVRKRADLEPKIVVQPFLDLVGGRLAEFAATPTEGAQTFSAVIEAMPRCFEEKIPNPTKKFTYKLSACDVGRATTRAYASLTSALAEQLWTPNSGIGWGKTIRATIELQWNTTEDPSQPYIELIAIKGLDWNS